MEPVEEPTQESVSCVVALERIAEERKISRKELEEKLKAFCQQRLRPTDPKAKKISRSEEERTKACLAFLATGEDTALELEALLTVVADCLDVKILLRVEEGREDDVFGSAKKKTLLLSFVQPAVASKSAPPQEKAAETPSCCPGLLEIRQDEFEGQVYD